MTDVVRLVAPLGWYLLRAAHLHEDHRFAGQKVAPLPHADGPWLVQFQRLQDGGRLTGARGQDLCEAWQKAQKAVFENYGDALPPLGDD